VAPDAFTLKPLLDENGLTVCAAHVVLPERSNASLLFDEQEYLGNDLLIVSGGREDFVTLDAIARFAERLNEAASLAAARGMRVGYHNHPGSGTRPSAASLDTSCLLGVIRGFDPRRSRPQKPRGSGALRLRGSSARSLLRGWVPDLGTTRVRETGV
jgi:Xylose isomerase-like TIM barrel